MIFKSTADINTKDFYLHRVVALLRINMSNNAEGKEVLEELLRKFRNNMKKNGSLKEKMKDFDRDIQIDFESGDHYNLTLKEGEISEIKDGTLEDADITLTTEVETLKKLINNDLGPMEAYAKNKISLDASFSDLLKFKKLVD